jgi:DeoR family fructose operon transcriptional repressor
LVAFAQGELHDDRVAAEERQRMMLDLARARGSIEVKDLALRFAVSMETIRRDLNLLEGHGLIRRAYGHAYPVETAAFETDLGSREVAHLDEKRRIAEEAVPKALIWAGVELGRRAPVRQM